MSKTVDERIVSMQFDNKHFEKNVQQSMSTLDKLKAKLNLSGSAKGFEEIGAAANKVNFSGLNSGIDTVHAKFSALQVMGVTALANITNSAVTAGKNIVKAFTIDPVKTGFQEYETQINAVQTILANTKSKGSTLEDVNKALDELNEYADQTIYNFTEMTRNIGTFTAAGVDLDKSVTSIKGIANLAAVSGSNAQQASTAMYQLSQAIAAGKVSLMDWNSVVNAGMGGEVFQEALKRTSRQLGTGVDQAIEKYGTFRESLTQGAWLTTEVLTETLTQLSGAYTEADLIAQGYTEEQAKEITELAKTAVSAATDVKTFTGLMDTLKESVQSGWTQTWELIFGDFEEAKQLWTGLSNFLGGFINKSAENRNNLLKGALMNSPFGELAKKIEKVTGVTEEMTKATKNFGEVVDKVIGGEFGNGQKRIDALTKAGYDWAHIQNLVNEKLGDSTRHATDFKESQDELQKTQATTIEQLIEMSDAQLKSLGFTQSEIKAFRDLEEQSEKTGIPIKKLLEDMDQLNGRTLLINSFKNAGQGLVSVFNAMGKAWREIFPPMTSDQLYGIIAGLHKLSTYLVMSEETADKLKRTFRGLFSIIDIITTIVGGGFKAAFKGVSAVLGAFDMDILDLTANLGDAIYNFRNFLFENNLVVKGLKKLANGMTEAAVEFKNFIDEFMALPEVQAAIDRFKESISDFKEIGRNIIEGLQNGLEEGISGLVEKMKEIGNVIIDTIKSVLGIHSPSRVMIAIGGMIMAGLILGIKNFAPDLWNSISVFGSDLVSKFTEIFNKIPWDKLAALGVSVGLLLTVKKLIGIAEAITAPLEGIGAIFESTAELISDSTKNINKILKNAAKVVNSFSKVLGSLAFSIKAAAIKDIAISIAILAGSVFLLAQLDTAALWGAIGALVALAGTIGILSASIGKFGPEDALNFGAFSLAVLAISSSLLIMTFAFRKLEKTDPDKLATIIGGFVLIVGSLLSIISAYSKLVRGGNAAIIEQAGKMFLKLAFSMLLMAAVMRIIAGMSAQDLLKGAAAILAFVGIIALLALITRFGKGIAGLGKTLLAMSAALILLVIAVKLLAGLSASEIIKGGLAILAFVGIMALLALITRWGKGIAGLATTLLAMSASMLIMALVVKLLANMSLGDIAKGVAALLAFTGIVALLTAITRIAKADTPKLGGTLMGMAVAVGILAGIAVLLSLIDLAGLAKGITAVGMLSAFMALMIAATRGANDCMKNLIVLTVAIAVFATAVAALSFIDPEKLIPATVALATIMGMFALMEKAGSTLNASMKSLITMVVVVGILATIVFIIGNLKIENAIQNTVALSTLLLAFSASMKILSSSKDITTQAMLNAVLMSVLVGIFAVILWGIQDLPVKTTLANTIALSTLLLAFSASMKILGTIKGMMPAALAAAALMAVVAGILAFILYKLQDLPVGTTLVNTLALSTLLLALSASCLILGTIGLIGPMAFVGVGVLAALIVSMGVLMGAIGALVHYNPILGTFLDESIPILEKIGLGLGAFFGGVVAGFSASVASTLPYIGECISSFATNLEPGIAAIKKIDGDALAGAGTLVGIMALIGGATILDSISKIFNFGKSPMEAFGENLELFATAMTGFSDSISGVSPYTMKAVADAGKALAEMQLILGMSDVFSFFGGETNLEKFGEQITKFGEAIVAFSTAVSADGAIDSEAITAAKDAAMIMVELQKAVVPVGGIAQSLDGTQDLGVFGDQISKFGTAIVGFSNAVSVEGAINTTAIESAKNAGMIMVELQKAIVPSGGVVQWFTGRNDLEYFGKQIELFGKSLVDFSNTVTNDGGINLDAATAALNAGLIMTELQKVIVPSGGVVAFFTGRDNLGYFGKQIMVFGNAMVQFSNTVTQNGGIRVDAVEAAANAGLIMTELQAAIPEDHWFDGKMSLSAFGDQLIGFGRGIKGFANQVAEIDPNATMSSLDVADRLVAFANSIIELDTTGIESFGSVTSIGTTIRQYAGSVSDLNYESVYTSINIVNQLKNLLLGLNVIDTMGATAFNTAMNALGKTSIDKFINSFKTPITKLKTIGQTMITNVIDGAKSKQSALVTTAKKLAESMIKAIDDKKESFKNSSVVIIDSFVLGLEESSVKINTKWTTMLSNSVAKIKESYDSFKNAGKYLVEGFAAGINENTYMAEAKARAMARAAANAAKSELDINSPSKVFYGIGRFSGQGFVNALGDYAKRAYTAGSGIANSARNGLSNAIGKISAIIDSGMDTNPTIRPVLDLSDVRSGASTIGDMLQLGDSLSMRSNIGAIGYMMKQNRQNGTNDDVISAINKLRDGLSGMGGNHYNINGITYDDGSNIAEAIETIVRAARMERRV